jgi:D-alanine-D-alanine ligase
MMTRHSTMHRKQRVGLLFGGKSAEHEVSLKSAKNVHEALDPSRFEAVLIKINPDGRWQDNLSLVPGGNGRLVCLDRPSETIPPLDVIFPVLHGPMGEDGTMQGLLELADVPYVGAGVLGSAIGMDKDVMKRLLQHAGLPVTPFLTLRHPNDYAPAEILAKLSHPVFVKPANMGSSVGVSRATTEAELAKAIKLAFTYDQKILVEQAVIGDEVECSVLGNADPQTSALGRIIPGADFYSYKAKYHDQNTVFEIPAKLPPSMVSQIQQIAVRAFQTLEGEGMARVDLFVTKNGQILVNELNTIPGFTAQSVYPKLWEASGLSYRDLISRLIDLAFERHERRQKLQSSFSA